MNNRNLLASFELDPGNEQLISTIAEAINHVDNCFVQIVEHWKDDTDSWNTYAIVQPSLAYPSSDGLTLDVKHIVTYEFSAGHLYTTGVDCWKKYSVGRDTDATVYIYRRVPRKEIQPFISAYRKKMKELKQSIDRTESDFCKALNALGTSKLCLYR